MATTTAADTSPAQGQQVHVYPAEPTPSHPATQSAAVSFAPAVSTVAPAATVDPYQRTPSRSLVVRLLRSATDLSYLSFVLLIGVPTILWIAATAYVLKTYRPITHVYPSWPHKDNLLYCEKSMVGYLFAELVRHAIVFAIFLIVGVTAVVTGSTSEFVVGHRTDESFNSDGDWVQVWGMPTVRFTIFIIGPLLDFVSLVVGWPITMSSTLCRDGDNVLWTYSIVHLVVANKLPYILIALLFSACFCSARRSNPDPEDEREIIRADFNRTKLGMDVYGADTGSETSSIIDTNVPINGNSNAASTLVRNVSILDMNPGRIATKPGALISTPAFIDNVSSASAVSSNGGNNGVRVLRASGAATPPLISGSDRRASSINLFIQDIVVNPPRRPSSLTGGGSFRQSGIWNDAGASETSVRSGAGRTGSVRGAAGAGAWAQDQSFGSDGSAGVRGLRTGSQRQIVLNNPPPPPPPSAPPS